MEGSNSEDKENQIPGRIMQLLKPVLNNPFSASPKINWFMINVIRHARRASRRYYFNMSRYSRYVRNVLPDVLASTRYRNCHIIFLSTPTRDFIDWLIRFPMGVIHANKSGRLSYINMKVVKVQRRRKIPMRKPNKKGGASLTQLLRPPQLALAFPNERTTDPSDLSILQSPNQTDNELEKEYTEG